MKNKKNVAIIKCVGLLQTIIIFQLIFLNPVNAQEYIIGADLSFLKSGEDNGYVFKENNVPKKGLLIFQEHGYNWIRLRLFHTPDELPNDLNYTISLAKEAKQLGYKFLLDFHYSDTWADPAKQFIPKAWERLSHSVLLDSIYEYTKNTMIAFRVAGAMPEMVQVGNEIIHGMIWPDGKLPENWKNFAELVQAGINGVYAGCGNQVAPEIMIHIDQGGDNVKTQYFYDSLMSYGVDFDIIGQSYYPWWHGSLLDLRENMIFMAETYKKPIVLVEVAYCYEPTEYIDKPAPFPETPEGQKEFLDEVNRVVLATPNNLGRGIMWWEPATPDMRGISTRDMFNENGNVLPAITVFDRFSRY